MSRYARSFEGEKRTAKVTLKLTPNERAALETGAAESGASLSEHTRELCLRRSGGAPRVAGARRNPESAALINELRAIGNNLNQLSYHCNTERTAPQQETLRQTTDLIAAAVARILAL
jgi:hypothetical protein